MKFKNFFFSESIFNKINNFEELKSTGKNGYKSICYYSHSTDSPLQKVFGFLLGVVILEIMGNLKGRWCILVTL